MKLVSKMKTFTTKDLIDFVKNQYKGEVFNFRIERGHKKNCGRLLFEYSKFLNPNMVYHACGYQSFDGYMLDKEEISLENTIKRFAYREVPKEEVLKALIERQKILSIS